MLRTEYRTRDVQWLLDMVAGRNQHFLSPSKNERLSNGKYSDLHVELKERFANLNNQEQVVSMLIEEIGGSKRGKASALVLGNLFGVPSGRRDALGSPDFDWRAYRSRWAQWWRDSGSVTQWDHGKSVLLVSGNPLNVDPGLAQVSPVQ